MSASRSTADIIRGGVGASQVAIAVIQQEALGDLIGLIVGDLLRLRLAEKGANETSRLERLYCLSTNLYRAG